ncbi:MAG TPA: succinate--CoA ligase subunit beta, partial [Candidatus Bathyarchaeia archaeon]
AETEDGGFVAVDARLIIDDNAVFRHKEYQEKIAAPGRENTPEETEAQKIGIAYVKLEGNIGVIGNGAGLVMSTLDMVQFFGGKPANFLDLGGGAPLERIIAALKIVLADQNVKVLLINILGGMTKCDDVARGIVDAKSTLDSQLPIVVRLMGTNEEEGKRILNDAQIQVLDSMEESAQRAVELAEV